MQDSRSLERVQGLRVLVDGFAVCAACARRFAGRRCLRCGRSAQFLGPTPEGLDWLACLARRGGLDPAGRARPGAPLRLAAGALRASLCVGSLALLVRAGALPEHQLLAAGLSAAGAVGVALSLGASPESEGPPGLAVALPGWEVDHPDAVRGTLRLAVPGLALKGRAGAAGVADLLAPDLWVEAEGEVLAVETLAATAVDVLGPARVFAAAELPADALRDRWITEVRGAAVIAIALHDGAPCVVEGTRVRRSTTGGGGSVYRDGVFASAITPTRGLLRITLLGVGGPRAPAAHPAARKS